MPSYSADVINDEAAADLYAYIRTLRDDPPEIQDIAVFTQILENALDTGDSPEDDAED